MNEKEIMAVFDREIVPMIIQYGQNTLLRTPKLTNAIKAFIIKSLSDQREAIVNLLEEKLLIRCECEDGDCPNCQRLLEVLSIIQEK